MHRECKRLAKPYIVTSGRGFRLTDRATRGPHAGHDAKKFLKKGVKALSEMQEKLYAQDRWGVLLIFQEMDHDFLWRTSKCLPERGRIGIFNRSYYEETLIVRVHPTILERQKMPPKLVTKRIWQERFEDINAFERYLSRQGFLIRKFFLHVSRREQRNRFLARLDRPEKHWKFQAGDLAEREYWRQYQTAYEDAIRHTATPHAPWVVVPADDKKFARTVVAAAIVDALAGLKLKYPEVDEKQRADLRRAQRMLRGEGRR